MRLLPEASQHKIIPRKSSPPRSLEGHRRHLSRLVRSGHKRSPRPDSSRQQTLRSAHRCHRPQRGQGGAAVRHGRAQRDAGVDDLRTRQRQRRYIRRIAGALLHPEKCERGTARHSCGQRLRIRAADGADESQDGAAGRNAIHDVGRKVLLSQFANRARDRQPEWTAHRTCARDGGRASAPQDCRETGLRHRNASQVKGQTMTTAGIQLSSFLTNRIQRIEVSATMAVVAEAEKLRTAGADLVDFGAGEPHFPTPAHIKEAAIAAIHNNFSKYTAVAGTAELRDAIIKRHATDFGSDYKREDCIATVGGKHALFNALQVLVDHGDEVILPVPYWVSFKDIVRYAGGEPVYVATDERHDFDLTAEMVERAITPRTKVIVLNSPSNPSGAVMKPDHMTSVLRLAHDRGIYVVSDECYVYLNFTGHLFSAGCVHEVKERLIIIGSLSKTYAMTGWRLGYALGPAPIISAMQKLQSQSTSNPTSIVQKAAVTALTSSQDCVREMLAGYISLRDKVVEGLRAIPGLTCASPNGAFYAYPNVSHYFGKSGMNSASDAARKLLHEAHAVVVPGEAFGTQDHVRMSYAVSDKELDRGLERMRQFFASL